ncbi:MAG: SDR family oxidoreductase [Verrucomicrobiota bacterium]
MNAQLEQKVVLVTGAAGGIGSSLARKFAAEGARLILHYHSRQAEAEQLSAELAHTGAVAIQADLSQESQVIELFSRARSAFGRIDTLVANAAIWVEGEVPLHEMSLAQWNRTLAVDLTAVFICCREFMKLVREQRRGNVVLISSTAGVFGEAGHADYASAKSALAYGFTRTLKNEISRIAPHTTDYCGGRINCICPGWTITPRTQPRLANREVIRKVTTTMALPQIARPDDVAHMAVFLASDTLARHITGQTIVIAGGMEGRVLWQADEIDPDTV